MLLLQSALQGAEWRPWLRQGVGALLTLALRAVLNVVSLKVSLALTGYQLADTGNGLAQMFRLGPAAVLAGIPATYGNFFKTLLGYSGWNDRGMRAATALLFVLAALAGLRWLVVLHDRKAAAAAVVLVALLPAAANVTDVINTGATVALRMAGSLAIVVPFAIAVIDAAKRTDHARPIEHCLRQRRLARVHMGKQPHAKPFFRPFRSLCVHCRSPFVMI